MTHSPSILRLPFYADASPVHVQAAVLTGAGAELQGTAMLQTALAEESCHNSLGRVTFRLQAVSHVTCGTHRGC